MKKSKFAKILSVAMSLILVLGLAPSFLFTTPAIAEDSTANETIEGPEVTVSVPDENIVRETLWNEGWKFAETSADCSAAGYNDSDWSGVSLPHDYSISKDFTTSGEAESGFLLGGSAWYRKSFLLSAAHQGTRKIINFDGVYKDATLYVNGKKIGEHHYGYSAFSFDITDSLVFDGSTQNVVALKCEHATPSSRWYSGSGIFRDVKMYTLASTHIAPNGVQVTTPNVASGNGTVHVEAELVNNSNTAADISFKSTVYSAATDTAVSVGVPIATSIPAASTSSCSADIPVSSFALWSPENPNLYYVTTEIYAGDQLLDSCNSSFGYKWTEWDNDGFKLNGVPTKINGVCLHHDQGALGSAGYNEAFARQITLLKEMGCNAIRTSHNPHDEDFMRLCSELGIMVMEDNFDGWDKSKNGNSNDFGRYFMTTIGEGNNLLGATPDMKWFEYSMSQQIKRDRNQACLIAWCIGNEISEGGSTSANFPTISARINELVTQLDSTGTSHNHVTTLGNNGKTDSYIVQAAEKCDIIGLNYNIGQIAGKVSTYGKLLRTETASHVNSRGTYQGVASASNVDGAYHLTSYDTSRVGWGQTAHDTIYTSYTNDAVFGEFAWTGFDYIGEPTPWNGTGSGSVSGKGAVPNSAYFGIIDTAGLPKDIYYMYQAQWRQDGNTTLHIVNAWDEANMVSSTTNNRVDLYSNAPYVELYLGGELIGTAIREAHTSAAGHTYYTYTSTSVDSTKCDAISRSGAEAMQIGFTLKTYDSTKELSARAYTSSDKTKQISDTTGTSSISKATNPSIHAKADTTQIEAGQLAYVDLDMQGLYNNISTTSDTLVSLSLNNDNARIVGVDNGDQATTQKFQNSSALLSPTTAQIKTFRGKAIAIVEGTKAGTFSLTASAAGSSFSTPTITVLPASGAESEVRFDHFSYVQDYSILEGTDPALNANATGYYSDGKSIAGTIVWDDLGEIFKTAGDYNITGTLTFAGDPSIEAISVSGRLHVVPDCLVLQNAASACAVNTMPALPATVNGLDAQGNAVWDYQVTWEALSAADFSSVGTKLVNGTVRIPSKGNMAVTCSVSVENITIIEGQNIGTSANISDDINGGADNKASLNDGNIPNDDSYGSNGTRWSNWNVHNSQLTTTLTFAWDTVHIFAKSRMHYFKTSGVPASIKFYYDGGDGSWRELALKAGSGTQYEQSGYRYSYEYAFDQIFTAEKIKVEFTQPNITSDSCIALYETEFFEASTGGLEYDSADTLSGIQVDAQAIDNFDPENLSYDFAGGNSITVTSDHNLGITILPEDEGIIRIVTLSEDGQNSKTYEVRTSSNSYLAENLTALFAML